MTDFQARNELSEKKTQQISRERALKPLRKKTPPKLAVINQNGCTGCEVCIVFCPVDCIEMVKPGAYYGDIQRKAEQMFREAGFRDQFTHRLGHWVGLEVHDVGDASVPLAPGMVVTVEPGLYLQDQQIGVRIEDDVLVTPEGHRVLTEALPRDPDAVERMMQEQ